MRFGASSLTLQNKMAPRKQHYQMPSLKAEKPLITRLRPAASLFLFFAHRLVLSLALAQIYPPCLASQLPPNREISSLPASCRDAIAKSDELSRAARGVSAEPTAKSYSDLGSKLSQAGRDACAIPLVESALSLDPELPEAHYGLAAALIRTHHAEQALPHLQFLLKRDPRSFEAHNAMGSALQDLGKQDAAEHEFRTALEINPHSITAAFNLAKLLGSEKKFTAEEYFLQGALKSNPDEKLMEPLQLSLAGAFEGNGETDRAIEVLQSLLRSHPSSPAGHGDLATLYAKHFRFHEAKPEYERVLDLDPANDAARLSLAKVLVELGDGRSASHQVQQYILRAPKDYDGQFVLGQIYKMQGDYEDAAVAFRHAADLNAGIYEVHYDLGVVLAHLGRLDEAIQELDRAKKLNPLAAEPPYQLSLIYRKTHDTLREHEEAAAFQEAKSRAQKSVDASHPISQGNEFLAHGDYVNAAQAYREALTLQPESAKLHYNLALALDGMGKIEEETRELQKAISLDPNYPDAHNRLGTLALKANKLADAEREFRAAWELNPRYAEAENNLGTLYGREARPADAIKFFEKATEDNPNFGEAFLNLGADSGQPEKVFGSRAAASKSNHTFTCRCGRLHGTRHG